MERFTAASLVCACLSIPSSHTLAARRMCIAWSTLFYCLMHRTFLNEQRRTNMNDERHAKEASSPQKGKGPRLVSLLNQGIQVLRKPPQGGSWLSSCWPTSSSCM